MITSGDHAQRTSFQNLLGDRYEELLPLLSLERRGKSSTPPQGDSGLAALPEGSKTPWRRTWAPWPSSWPPPPGGP